jgi:hypothetical protein
LREMRDRGPVAYLGWLAHWSCERLAGWIGWTFGPTIRPCQIVGYARSVSTQREVRQETAVVVLTVLFTCVPFVLSASHAGFWQERHDMAPAVLGFQLVVTIVLIPRWRWSRWSWALLVFAEGLALISYAIDGVQPFLVVNAVALALLLSPPMRRHIKRRGTMPAPAYTRLRSCAASSF